MRLDLDHTLGCGQAHRWRLEGGRWEGVLDGRRVSLWMDGGLRWEGVGASVIERYLRADDDVDSIYREISEDPLVASLVRRYDGLRILRQDPWECTATYVIATNANIPRIRGMVESVCRTFGEDLGGGWYSFPSPEAIVDRADRASGCGLGYRCDRLVSLARAVHTGDLDLGAVRDMGYEDCVAELKRHPGIGDKVADCIALFSLDHLDAFPVDVRIKRVLEESYGQTGTYRRMREFGRERFGRYCGYAQEFLFMGASGRRSPAPRSPSGTRRC